MGLGWDCGIGMGLRDWDGIAGLGLGSVGLSGIGVEPIVWDWGRTKPKY